MLEKLAKQTAVYGISTIAVRFLSYLLTPVFTRVFEPEAYGIIKLTLASALDFSYLCGDTSQTPCRFAEPADVPLRCAGTSGCDMTI